MASTPPGEPTGPPPAAAARRRGLGAGLTVGLVVGAIIAAAVVAFIAQNTDSVEMQWLGFSFSWPLAASLFAALAAGVVLALIGQLLWKVHRHRRARR